MKKILIKGGFEALVDDEDFNGLARVSWHINLGAGNNPYARGAIYDFESNCYKKHLMHRIVMKVADPKIKLDHIDGNGLNNQKSNLRICSDSQNMFNRKKQKNTSSKYKGVCFRPKDRNYMARLNLEGKSLYIGRYESEIEAALAYNVAASFAFREFANLNKIEV